MNGGLAANAAQQTQSMNSMDQIIAMLQQGVTPEELIAQGVPEELVLAAIEALTKAATQIPPRQEGLAGMALKG
jgi:hypothetical protein